MTDLRYPLHYPTVRPRTQFRRDSRFDPHRKRTFGQARDELVRQLRLLGAQKVQISSNIPLRQDGLPYANHRNPDDPGVAVYFEMEGVPKVWGCDRWKRAIDNAWAIAKDIEAVRKRLDWGCVTAEESFPTYQLPDANRDRPWWEVLGISQFATHEEIKLAYRDEAQRCHPDRGGNRAAWDRLQAAHDQALEQLKTYGRN